MGIFEYLIASLAAAPSMIFWIAVIIYGIVKLNRGGGRAEGFLITGGSIKLIGNILGIANFFIVPWFFNDIVIKDDAITLFSGFGIIRTIISMIGFLCLLYGFWLKFKALKEVKISP